MKSLLVFLLIAAGSSSVFAQTILLKSGKTIPAGGMVRQEDMLMVPIKSASGGSGKIGYYISDIAELNLPAPDAIANAANLMAKGDFAGALVQIEPVVAEQETIRDIPGNWWAKAALTKVSVLLGLNRATDANKLVGEIVGYSKDPEILTSAKLQIALATKFTDPGQAIAAYDAVISQSSDPGTLSQAWIAEGDVHLAQHEFDEALMAYLTVTVFYPDHNSLAPRALWGSGQAYAKLKDVNNAKKTFQTLISSYPDSPEASLAKAELIKKDKKT